MSRVNQDNKQFNILTVLHCCRFELAPAARHVQRGGGQGERGCAAAIHEAHDESPAHGGRRPQSSPQPVSAPQQQTRPAATPTRHATI